jgi:NAD(P)-dependent dehydrogenase (short-subunit alcohol dehydrogenase family)
VRRPGWYLSVIQILNANQISEQSGRIAVITGGGAGLGRETAKALAEKAATVVLAVRSRPERSTARIVPLDLASLSSVRAGAEEIRSTCDRLDLLINNAGVMEVPYQRTDDGFELTFATNHLGHFALTGHLLELLLATPGSRVVTVSSNAHRRGVMHFDDLQFERGYDAAAAYAQSKLANLLFTYELQARLEAIGAGTIALAAHPGNARTGLWRTSSPLERALVRMPWLAQSAAAGAQATLLAAVDPSARGGEYYGPSGPFQYTGRPTRVESSARSHDPAAQRRLWEVSEQLTGVSYPAAHAGQGRPLPPR